MKYEPKFKAMWKGEEYIVTAMHLLEDPYVMLEYKNKDNYEGEKDIYVEFSELESFYDVQTKYYIKLKYNLGYSAQNVYYNKSLTGKQDFFWYKRQEMTYQTQFTYSEIMNLPEEIQNGLNGGLLELGEIS